MVATMLPELAADLHTSIATASSSVTVYMVPFAGCMVFSGTLAERFGRRRTVRIAYLVYAVASLLCALAPSVEWLLAGRAMQGMANAFTTPVLVAAISSLVAPQQLGRALGLYASMQALGQSAAPLVGGLAAEVHWSWAFYGSAVAAALLALVPPPDSTKSGARPGRWAALVNPQLVLACAIAALAYLSSMGVTILGALIAADRFGLGPTGRGAVVAVFGLAGLITARWLGAVMDRSNRLVFGSAAHLVLGLGTAAVGLWAWLPGVVAAVAVAGAGGAATRTTANSLAVTSAPENRSGATSMMLAFQFGGAALAPLIWVPLYARQQAATMVWTALPAVLAGGVLLAVWLFRSAARRPAARRSAG